MAATAAALAQGRQRGEIRADEPAESLAVIALYAMLFRAAAAPRSAGPQAPPRSAAWPCRSPCAACGPRPGHGQLPHQRLAGDVITGGATSPVDARWGRTPGD